MADLVIGGNTYKDIDYVQIKKADGSTATFCDFARKPTATIRKET